MLRLRRAVAITLALLACAAAFACSLVAPLDDSAYGDRANGSDGGAGGATDGAAVEATSPDGTVADTGTGTGTADGHGGDAGDGGCPVKFCDDFERTNIQGAWNGTGTENGGKLAIILDTAPGSSHGHVLELTGCPDPTKACAANLSVAFDAGPAMITYAFDVRTHTAPMSGGNFSGIDLGQGTGPDPQAFLLLTGGANCNLADQVPGTSAGFGNAGVGDVFPTGTWVHVEMDFALGTNPYVQVDIDGQETTSSIPLPSEYFQPAPFSIIAGVFYSQDAVQYVYDIDNVTIDFAD